MECNFKYPVSTLKVDFGCSKDCPTDVKNMLQQLKGVKAISIDPNEGTVTVEGNVNPMALIKLLHKIGKKAQLQSFDKAPLKSKDGSQLKQNQTPHCCCKSEKQIEHCCCGSSSSSSDSKDDSTRHKTRHGRRSKKNQGCNEGYGTYGNRNVAAVGTGYNNYHPPMPGYHQPFTGHHYPPRPKYYQPFTGYNYHPAMPGNQSMAYAAAAAPPPPYAARRIPLYGYYGRGQPLPPYTYR